MQKIIKGIFLLAVVILTLAVGAYLNQRYQNYKNFHTPAAKPPSVSELKSVLNQKQLSKSGINKNSDNSTRNAGKQPNIFLGINTADVREDTSSIPFLNLFKPAIPFAETVPWGSTKDVEYDRNGYPTDLKGGKAGTKFLNRLPANTIEDGFYTVLYDGEGEIFYGNDARLVVHRPGKDIIEIKAGNDNTLNASLFIKKTTKDNYIRNIRILPDGGICDGHPHIKVNSETACKKGSYLSFEEHHHKILFNPDYLNFMKDFQVVRFMNMAGMTRNPVESWNTRNTLEKATWGGRAGLYSRGAPVEVMVALANQINAHPWFSMPYKANDDYVRKFGEYVKANLNPDLKAYIEYSNEVWNPIFIHHDYAIQKGLEEKLDSSKSPAGYKWYSKRSVEVFKIWEEVFGGNEQLVRVMGSWASNQNMSSQILAFQDAYKYTDAVAIGPYVSAHPKVLRKAKNVDDVFQAMMDKNSKWGMKTIISYIQKQQKVASSFGVDLIAYEGGQHLVDWDTRKVEEHPNPLLYAANRDPRMGIVYDELLREWQKSGGKLFVAFSAPRIYSWYGSWGVKEHIRQARADAPKYDSLMRYLDQNLYPEKNEQAITQSVLIAEQTEIKVPYAKTPELIWNMQQSKAIPSKLLAVSDHDFSAKWQANWDTRHLYFSFSIKDNDIQKGDEIVLTLDATNSSKTDNKTAKNQISSSAKKKDSDENAVDQNIEKVKTFTFTPYDSLGSQTHLIETDTGYQLNIAIPWSELFGKDSKSHASSGYLIGINISVVDVDEDVKGSKSIYWADTSKPLPKLVLDNTPVVN